MAKFKYQWIADENYKNGFKKAIELCLQNRLINLEDSYTILHELETEKYKAPTYANGVWGDDDF